MKYIVHVREEKPIKQKTRKVYYSDLDLCKALEEYIMQENNDFHINIKKVTNKT